MSLIRRIAFLLALLSLLAPGFSSSGQPQCGVARSVSYPVDPSQYTITQDFGVPSPRHQGRYHVGEDWYGGRGSYGAEVRAIADGRVTFSSPNGWGRDGGVVILEHTFPDGSVAYSMYGHVTDATGVVFPSVFTCVRQGDVIAAIGEPRPAPHLHFEIRTDKPDIPGPGYTWQDPTTDGWRRPSKFVANWQAWLLESYRWHADIADEAGPVAPPVQLSDLSLLVLDSNRVLRVSGDGRVLWRTILDKTAVGLVEEPTATLIVYTDGTVQPVSAEGTLRGAWQLDVQLEGAPMTFDNLVVFHTPDDGLVALNGDLRSVAWQLSDVPPIFRWAASSDALGVITIDNAMLTISPSGEIVDQALLREPGSLANNLLAYTRGGLWRVAADGTWSLDFADAPPGGRSSAAAEDLQRLFLFDGATLYAYDRASVPRWATALPGVNGIVSLSIYDEGEIVLLTSTHGDIIAVQAATGGVCNATHIYGSSRSREWHRLNEDGVLRVYVADGILGLDWNRFLMACRPA